MSKLSIIFYLSATVLGYVVPESNTKRNEPAPLALDFAVVTHPGSDTKNKRDAFGETVANYRDLCYQMKIYLGSNKKKTVVLIDTGSSDLFVPSTEYSPKKSRFSQKTGLSYGTTYIDGSVARGEYYLDTLQFKRGITLSNFQFGVNQGGGMGVLGIGNREGVKAEQQYDNLPWALHKAGITPKASYSLYLYPDYGSGVVIFGGIDTAKYLGSLTKYPIHDRGKKLTINLQSITVAGKKIPIDSPYCLDSGSTLGFLGKKVMAELDILFNTTIEKGKHLGRRTTSCHQPPDKYVEFDFGGSTISIPYADMIIDMGRGKCALGFAYYKGYQILGSVFLRKAYVYFDLSEQTISLAQSSPGKASNIVGI
ncbi:hypothetical protein JCM33374_g2641 [Metschnikowia sp. JCM 33374]|nr:hypothetical protein JCM33374_g2641 [Metschnikowia sp. JCM 33374]